MYLINQMAKITGLTKKALRYYDEQGILKPSFRDEMTQYRYYDESDVKKAQLIHMLKDLDFSISEMKDTIDISLNEDINGGSWNEDTNNPQGKGAISILQDKDDLNYILGEKIEQIEAHIRREKELIKEIRRFIHPVNTTAENKKHLITIENISPVLVASMQIKDTYDNIGNYLSTLYRAIKENTAGNLMNCYYDDEYTEIASMELCIPIKRTVSSSEVKCKTLPLIKAVCTTHYGNYHTLYLAYQDLFQYINENKIVVSSPYREVYEKGPGMIFKGNENKYITKIMIPIED